MSSSISDPSPPRWQRDERALFRVGPEDAVVVLGSKDSAPRALRGTGAALWEALARPCTVDEVAALLGTEFDADSEKIRRDIEPVIEQLSEAGVLRAAP